ncbi:hypothetical protein BH11PLA2_BH11PLA2_02880 [soil metagenome]
MKLRTVALSAATLGILAGNASAAEPAKMPAVKATAVAPAKAAPMSNQQLADSIYTKLTTTGSAFNADVSLSCTDGIVTLTGTCKDVGTKAQIIQDVRVVAGVTKVRDGLTVGAIRQVQDTAPMTLPPAVTPMPLAGPRVGPTAMPAMTSMPPQMSNGPMIEPVPLGAGGGMGSAEMNAPPLPPNAWPTYAPHNNVSRVAYPQAYPYNAFPFIGPYYPFPKVPLGWRKVTLEWEDGHWWYGRQQTPNDYWKVRFW